jgi:DNA-binding NtrC family response regulator
MRPPESILVVSPDATTLQGLSRALMQRGVPVAPALGWTEGESRLHRVPVSLVVTDMEGATPEELATVRRLRAKFPDVTVIALVSLFTPEIGSAQRDGLLRAVLEKPIALGQLEEAVKTVLSRDMPS